MSHLRRKSPVYRTIDRFCGRAMATFGRGNAAITTATNCATSRLYLDMEQERLSIVCCCRFCLLLAINVSRAARYKRDYYCQQTNRLIMKYQFIAYKTN